MLSTTDTPDTGIIYVATKTARYVEEAFLSAESIKALCPHIHITLFTDIPDNPLCDAGVFDGVVKIQSVGGYGLAWAEGQLDRLVCLSRTPYKLTLNLDTDTRCYTQDVAKLFDVLKTMDVGMVEDLPEFSYARLYSQRRMFNAGLILYQRNSVVLGWLEEWEARVRRNFSAAMADELPDFPELHHVPDDATKRSLLRIDQIALMELLSPDVNRCGARLAVLDQFWNYRGKRERHLERSIRIFHSESLKTTTKPDILSVAFKWAEKEVSKAEMLYGYVAESQDSPARRRSWLNVLSRESPQHEEWLSPALKRSDLHLKYGQPVQASAILDTVNEEALVYQVHAGRARCALMMGMNAEAVQVAEEAVRLKPSSPYAAFVYGAALLARNRQLDAIAALTKASRGGYAAADRLLGHAWLKVRRYKEAGQAYKKVLSHQPDDFASANNLLPSLLGQRRYKEALVHSNAMLAKKSWQAGPLAFKCVALSELNGGPELSSLVDHPRLVVTEILPAPQGFRDIAAFNKALARALSADPTLQFEPKDHATRGGFHTQSLANSNVPAIKTINGAAIAAAQRRMSDVDKASAHPFDQNVPRIYELHSWSVIMHEQGHQIPHIHAKAWISGVYYVQVPDDIRPDDPEKNGWLEFGQSEERWHTVSGRMPLLQICPVPGLLVTFPSFFWHNTRPLSSAQKRISFAFDMVPG